MGNNMHIRSEQQYTCTDIAGAETVEVQIRDDGKVVWINIDGICRFRVQRFEQLLISDERAKALFAEEPPADPIATSITRLRDRQQRDPSEI